MKKKILSFLALFLSSFIIYSFIGSNQNITSESSVSSSYPNRNISDKFIFGAMENISASDANLDSLKLNTQHKYTGDGRISAGRMYPTGVDTNDWVLGDTSYIISTLHGVLNSISPGRRVLLHRPRIEWLCLGQSSTYECESTNLNPDLWFYAFAEHNGGEDVLDSGKYVRHLGIPSGETIGTPGYAVKKLKANTEQCRHDVSSSERWKADSESRWFVKPRIRIPASYPGAHLNDTICKIKVIKQDGLTSVMNIGIRGRDFLDASNNYSGQYKEIFNFESGDNELFFDGDLGGNEAFSARGNGADGTNAHADIQVYWTGKCDMWIDYVKVENDIAQELFAGDWDPRIKQEVQQIGLYKAGGSTPVGLKFYIELTEFNNIPCMAYVNKKMKEYCGALGQDTIDLMTDLTGEYMKHLNIIDSWSIMNAAHIKRYYMDSVGFRQVFSESYPMTSNFIRNPMFDNPYSKIPNSLSYSGFLDLVPAAPATYDTWLQENLDYKPFILETGGDWTNKPGEFPQYPGYNRFWLNLCREISALSGKPFIHMPQAHMWYNHLSESRREPTNEEMEMLANVAITYGAKGFIYFWYLTIGNYGDTTNQFGKGMIQNDTLRRYNEYGQKDKSHTIRDIGLRTQKWEQYLLNFDNSTIKSFYYGEPSDTIALASTYFKEVITFKAGGTSPCSESSAPSSTVVDCRSERYVQVGMFDKIGETDSKYFMIVNRRCSPIVTGSEDGRRYIRIKFDANAPEFSEFNNWKIIDLEADTMVATFDKTVSGNIDLKWFKPGQGKLYKVVPVMKTGGTFMGDESFSSVSFNFNSPVNTNGKNLTIGGGVHIFFRDTCRLEMNGGNFICGTYTDDEENPKSVDLYEQSGSWRGIVLQNMDTVVMQNTAIRSVDSAVSYNDTVGIYMKHGISILNTKVVNIDNCNIFNISSG